VLSSFLPPQTKNPFAPSAVYVHKPGNFQHLEVIIEKENANMVAGD
jgi:hypothetical protein